MQAAAQYHSREELSGNGEEKWDSLNLFLICNVFALFPVIKELVVSAGESVQITLPKNEVQLNAYVLQEPDDGKISFTFG